MKFIHSSQAGVLCIVLLSGLFLDACRPSDKGRSQDQARATASLRTALDEAVRGSKAIFLPPGCQALLPKGISAKFPSTAESAESVSNPSSFHALNREYRFDRVFLLPGSLCASLRDHLLESPVWILSKVSPEGYLFRASGNAPWRAPDCDEAARMIPDPNERSLWLIGTAMNLIPIGHGEEASKLLELASCWRSHESQRLAELASLEAFMGHWEKALDLAGQALRGDRNNRTARTVMIRAEIETGHPDSAEERAKEFVHASPDAESFFLLARSANASGDHAGEIEALKNLVLIAKEQRQPVGASLLYLGQALARDGQRGEALRALEESERAPELTDTQRRLIRQLRDHLAPAS